MEYDSNLCSYLSSIDWDLHSFGVFNADMSLEVMEAPFSSDLSTGYLQDAITEWSNRCKRRRMLSYPPDQMPAYSQNCWNSDDQGDPFENFSSLTQNYNFIPDDSPLNSLWNDISNGSTTPTDMKTREPEQHENLSSSSSFHVDSLTKDPDEKDASVSKGGPGRNKKVAYPFDVVKPGGIEGDVTLNEINERILMRPTRPVRHPVGDLAFHPCVSAGGIGPSGKAVVALTRIHTQGRGTVTIIRTRG